jgi:hypothetical protein
MYRGEDDSNPNKRTNPTSRTRAEDKKTREKCRRMRKQLFWGAAIKDDADQYKYSSGGIDPKREWEMGPSLPNGGKCVFYR